MKYIWYRGRVHIEAVTTHDNEETTQHFNIDDLKDIIKEMRKLERKPTTNDKECE